MPSSTLTHPPWILADTIINNHSPPSLINPSHAYINHSSTCKATRELPILTALPVPIFHGRNHQQFKSKPPSQA
jgi:hypothetical protein